jgi:hypothetical protein
MLEAEKEGQVTLNQVIFEIPKGATHAALDIDAKTGKVVGSKFYGEGELMGVFQQIGMALGLHKAPVLSVVPAVSMDDTAPKDQVETIQ